MVFVKQKILQKKQVNEYKMTKRQIYKKFTNLSEKELNAKNNKKTSVRNDVMTTIIKRCRGGKTFRKKLMIPDSENPKCPEFEVKLKIGQIFKKHNPLEEYSVKNYEIDPYFYEHYEKKYKLIKMGVNIYYLELIFILVSVF